MHGVHRSSVPPCQEYYHINYQSITQTITCPTTLVGKHGTSYTKTLTFYVTPCPDLVMLLGADAIHAFNIGGSPRSPDVALFNDNNQHTDDIETLSESATSRLRQQHIRNARLALRWYSIPHIIWLQPSTAQTIQLVHPPTHDHNVSHDIINLPPVLTPQFRTNPRGTQITLFNHSTDTMKIRPRTMTLRLLAGQPNSTTAFPPLPAVHTLHVPTTPRPSWMPQDVWLVFNDTEHVSLMTRYTDYADDAERLQVTERLYKIMIGPGEHRNKFVRLIFNNPRAFVHPLSQRDKCMADEEYTIELKDQNTLVKAPSDAWEWRNGPS